MAVPSVSIAISTRQGNDGHNNVFSTVVLKYGIPLQEQMTDTNKKYVVKWNFNLETGTLIIPENCILEFDGGQISEGNIEWNSTKVHNPYKYEILHNIIESGERINL